MEETCRIQIVAKLSSNMERNFAKRREGSNNLSFIKFRLKADERQETRRDINSETFTANIRRIFSGRQKLLECIFEKSINLALTHCIQTNSK